MYTANAISRKVDVESVIMPISAMKKIHAANEASSRLKPGVIGLDAISVMFSFVWKNGNHFHELSVTMSLIRKVPAVYAIVLYVHPLCVLQHKPEIPIPGQVIVCVRIHGPYAT